MGNPTDLPMQLWKANLDLQQRIGRLIQDSGRDWMELGTRAVGETVEEGDAEVREFLRSGDWHALASLPVDAFWRQAQQRFGDGQVLAQVAVNAQNAFANGLIEALQDWQKETSGLLADAGKASEPDKALRTMFEPWLAYQSAFIPPGGKGTKPRGG